MPTQNSAQFLRRFPRVEVFAFDINDIWSIDVAYVDKLAKYNHGKYNHGKYNHG